MQRENMKIEVELVSQSIVKPSSPTPDHFRHHQLSSVDQTMSPVFIPSLLFYHKNTNISNKDRYEHLKKSLAETLSMFYPLAGRFKENYIECNDEGVHLVEAEAKYCTIQDILQNPDCNDINKLLPFNVASPNNDLVTFVQITYFSCGGMAIGIGLSHVVGDGLSCLVFQNTWAAIASRDTNKMIVPRFDSATYFPPTDTFGFDSRFECVKDSNDIDIVLKRFVFHAPGIAALRHKYMNNAKYPIRPTRNEALTAFISSKLIAILDQEEAECQKAYHIYQPINLRSKFEPPLSARHFGNIILEPVVAVANVDSADQCYGILGQMRDTVNNVTADYIKRLQKGDAILNMMKERAERASNEDIVAIYFTNVSSFPLYEADFGWGKPAWVASGRWPYRNLVAFLDTKDGDGIEAFFHLEKKDMAKFETDDEVVALVSNVRNVDKTSAWIHSAL